MNLAPRLIGLSAPALVLSFAGCGESSATATLDPVALEFSGQPTQATAGASFTVQVQIVDAEGSRVPSASGAVSVALSGGSSGADFSGVTTVTPVEGVATFSDLTISRAGEGYALVASSAPLQSSTSSAFAVVAGQPEGLEFEDLPAATIAGGSFSATVRVVDAFGNLVTAASGLPVTLQLEEESWWGTTTRNTAAGQAVFDDLSIEPAQVYRLRASGPALTDALSPGFTVEPGPIARIRMNPTATYVRGPTGPSSDQLSASPEDEYGNAVSAGITWSSDDPQIATVSQQGVVSAFGNGVTEVRATAHGVDGTTTVASQYRTSNSIISWTEPGASTVGVALSPVGFTVSNVGTVWTGRAWVEIGENPSGATLSGNDPQDLTYYSSSPLWENLSIDKPGTYTLVYIVEFTSSQGAFGRVTDSFVVSP